jgi:hypothetical protein
LNCLRSNENISSSPLATSATDENITITIKEELETEQIPSTANALTPVSESVLANTPYDLSNNQRIFNNSYTVKIPHQPVDNNHEITNGLNIKPRVRLIYIRVIK